MDVLCQRLCTVFDHPSGAELLYSSTSFTQQFALPEFYRHIERAGLWCWALVVVDTAGRAFGCYSELPFAERAESCGRHDILFSMGNSSSSSGTSSDAAAASPQNAAAQARGDDGAEVDGGGAAVTVAAVAASFQSFEWNALTSSKLLAGSSQLRVSNRKGFDFCLYDGFSQGIRSASRVCHALGDQPLEFAVASVEVWVPANLLRGQ